MSSDPTPRGSTPSWHAQPILTPGRYARTPTTATERTTPSVAEIARNRISPVWYHACMEELQPGTEHNARELDIAELSRAIAARKRRELRKNGAVVARARRITRGGREHIGDRCQDRDAVTLTYLEHPDGTRELAVGARPDLSGWRSPSGIVSAVVVESRSRAARADRAETALAAQHTAKLAARRLLTAGTAAYRGTGR